MKVFFVIFIYSIPIMFSAYGLYLAFSASAVLGILTILFAPSTAIIGVIGLFNPHVMEHLAKWMGL